MLMRRMAALLVAPMLLASCVFTPGKFVSTMTVGADGRFDFAYKGEIVFISAFDDGDKPAEAQKCYGPAPNSDAAPVLDDSPMDVTDMNATEAAGAAAEPAEDLNAERPCTAEEQEEYRQNQAESAERKKQERAQAAQVFGFNPEDEATVREFAAQLSKQAGWRSVTYRGKGVFDVDYAIAGTLDRDFVFPVFPKTTAIFPMVVARKRADGAVHISAPAFAGPAASSAGMGAMMGMGQFRPDQAGKAPLPDGTFTIATDAEILTNNTEDGAVAAGARRTLAWRINLQTTAAPEALLKPRR